VALERHLANIALMLLVNSSFEHSNGGTYTVKRYFLLRVKVTEVDANLLRFRKLEELTLTGNYIRQVNSQHLPRTLKVDLRFRLFCSLGICSGGLVDQSVPGDSSVNSITLEESQHRSLL